VDSGASVGDAERPIASFFDPRSTVVIGASSDPQKWGGLVAEKLLRGEARRSVYLVNRTGAEILGRSSYRSVADLPEAPEFAAITVPRSAFSQAVDDALAVGVRAIVAITVGFSEVGPEGAALEREIVARVRAAGGALLGPNCMGVHDSTAQFECLAWADPPAGSLGMISQSGSLIMDVVRRGREYGLGISRAASVGNQADVTIAELVRSLADHEQTEVIAIYCEDVRDGREMFAAIERAIAGGTPVVVLAPTANAVTRRAAGSHTGALLSDDVLLDAACHASGAVLVRSIRGLVEAVHALQSPLRGSGRRIGIASDTGGLAVLSAAAVTRVGLEVPHFSHALTANLSGLSLSSTGTSNPVDIVGLPTIDHYIPVIETVVQSSEVDGVLFSVATFDSPGSADESGARFAAAAFQARKPLSIATSDLRNAGVERLRASGIPVFADVESAAQALAVLCRGQPPGLPRQVHSAERLGEDVDTYFGAREFLAGRGIPFARAAEVATAEQAVTAATALGYPVALKALGRLHKSDAGGVALRLPDAEAVSAAAEDMRARLDPASFAVEQMVSLSEGVEIAVGGRNDPRFGPVVLVGAGGIYTEILADIAVALAPVTDRQAERLVHQLRAVRLLLGARGRRPGKIDSLVQVIVTVSGVVAAFPEIHELDLNPVIVTPAEARAVDVRIVRAE
jgi:acyl-CoA synthetase (NDP forming)